MGFYEVYHRVASGKTHAAPQHDAATDEHVQVLHRENLEGFRGFLRSLMMHGAVGTAIGGVMTQVGEPQNLLIAEQAEWTFRRILPGDGAGDIPVCSPVSRPAGSSSASACSATARRCRTPRARCSRTTPGSWPRTPRRRDRQVVIVQAIVAVAARARRSRFTSPRSG